MAVPTGFELRTPQDWVDFSVADEASENRVADEVWTRAREGGFTEEQAGQYAEQLRRSVRQARTAGAVHAAGTFQVYENGALIATVLVSVVTPPATGDIIGALTAVAQPAHADGTWRRVSTTQIPAIGTVGRVHGIQNVTQDGATMRCAVMHTVVPLPGTVNVLVVTGSSPNLAEAEEIFELFATITATLSFTYQEEAAAPTPPAASSGEVGG
ncbi:hypothetical protein [Verrucosispora sp. WMMC514]|uniref:hypothetical protein n=1 Tax=Verrucosispora sp. WMMC514 TaxID=3015156 RepID=UPI00248BA826|nr:hypothetical protein [Verrucosispora sp. WMMC514]WBB89950.1 hypothetical protein O7597_23640 [Verrucosispora sp. WMMC514]